MRAEAIKAIAIAFLIALLPLWRVLRGETLLPGDVLEHCRAFEPTLPEAQRAVSNPELGDVATQYVASAALVKRSLHRGMLPLWDPHMLGGHPLIGISSAAILHPIQLLLVAALPVPRAFSVLALLNLTAAALACVLWFRRLGCGWMAASMGAATFSLSGYAMGWLSFVPFTLVLPAFPAAMLALDASRTRSPLTCTLVLGALLGLTLLGGHEQASCVLLVAVLVYGACLAAAGGARRFVPLLAGTAGVTLGLLLGSAQVLPLLERSLGAGRVPFGSSGLVGVELFPFSLRVRDFLLFLLPELWGGPGGWAAQGAPEIAVYCGLTALLALALAPWLVGRRPEGRAALLMVGVGALLASGSSLLLPLRAIVPGLAMMRPSRFHVLMALAFALLVALVLEEIRRGSPVPGRAAAAAAVLAIGSGIVGLIAFLASVGVAPLRSPFESWLLVASPRRDAPGDAYYRLLATDAGWLLGGIAVLVLLVRPARRRASALPLLLAIFVLADLVRPWVGFNRFMPPGWTIPRSPLAEGLAGMPDVGRVAFAEPGILPPNLARLAGVEDIAGYDSLIPARYLKLVSALSPGDASDVQAGLDTLSASPLLARLAVGHLVLASDPRLHEGLVPAGQEPYFEAPGPAVSGTAIHVSGLAEARPLVVTLCQDTVHCDDAELGAAIGVGSAAVRRLELGAPYPVASVRIHHRAEGAQRVRVTVVGEGSETDLVSPGIHLVDAGHIGPLRVLRNASADPRALLAASLRVVGDDAALETMGSRGYDPRRFVMISPGEAERLPPEDRDLLAAPGAVAGGVGIRSREATRVVLGVHTARKAVLYVADAFDPGWLALVDGRRVPLLRANLTFRALVVPAGDHVVELLFWPASLRIGGFVSLVALAAVLASVVQTSAWPSSWRRTKLPSQRSTGTR